VLRRGGQLLLCRRSRERLHYPGVWDLPGGHVDENESLQEAIRRELLEELGITARVPEGDPWFTQRVDADLQFSVFLVDAWVGEPRNCAVDEHEEVRWVSPRELAELELAHPAYVEVLTRAMAESG
jgi:8-oxo-dGTP diphosphatase